MDPTLNEESSTEFHTEPETEPGVTPRRRKQPKKSTIPIPSFLRHLGADVRWYYDIRLWSPLILLLLVLALLPGKQAEKTPEETIPAVTAVETLPQDTAPTEEAVIPEAAALARLADTVGAGRSDNVKTVIMWVAINRSEDRANGYGQSLLTEIARPNQWQGYDETALYTDETYAIAKQVLEIQANGGLRPLDSDMLWFVLNDDGSITLRNQFTATANQKWREKTVK
ncbi:MAG: hypothetical protein SOW84_06795 [Candidatus Faecousia sp.]|nr:hypothetical protein [Candidatus Faecousia sp.]